MKEALVAALLKLAIGVLKDKLDDQEDKKEQPKEVEKSIDITTLSSTDKDYKLDDLLNTQRDIKNLKGILQDVDLDDDDIIKLWKDEGKK